MGQVVAELRQRRATFDLAVMADLHGFRAILTPHQSHHVPRFDEERTLLGDADIAVEEVVGVRNPKRIGIVVAPVCASEGHVMTLATSEAQRGDEDPEVADNAIVLLHTIFSHEAMPLRLVAEIGLDRHVVYAVHHQTTIFVVVQRIIPDDQIGGLAGKVYVEGVATLDLRLAEVRKLRTTDEPSLGVRDHEVPTLLAATVSTTDDNVAV